MSEQSVFERSLARAGRLFGVLLEFDSGDFWSFSGNTLRVGLGYFEAIGHPEPEIRALTLLNLWRFVALPRNSSALVTRRQNLTAQRPEYEPLLATLDVLIAAEATARAFPAEAAALRAGLYRRLRHSSRTADSAADSTADSEILGLRHLEFLTWLIHPGTEVSADVAAAISRNSPPGHRLHTVVESVFTAYENRVSTATFVPQTATVELWETLFAVTRTPYLELLEHDFRARGIDAEHGDAKASEAAEEPGLGMDQSATEDAGGGSGDEAADPDIDAAVSDQRSEDSAPEDDPDTTRARSGSHFNQAEGADLFAGEQAGFVDQILATPLALDDAVAAALELGDNNSLAAAKSSASNLTLTGPAEPATLAAAPLGALAYRSKTQQYAREIDRVRQLWLSVQAPELTFRRARYAPAAEAGTELAHEQLAHTIAETTAGVRRPRAFQQFRMKARQRDDAAHSDYVFLIDRSASMQGATAEYTADAVLILLEALAGVARDIDEMRKRWRADFGLGIRTALVLFDDGVEVLKPLTEAMSPTVRHRLHDRIQQPHGATHDGVALASAEQLLREAAVPKTASGQRKRVVFVIGDGGSHDVDAAAEQLRLLRSAGTRVVALGVGATGMEMVARYRPDGHWVQHPKQLPRVFEQVFATL